VPEDEDLEAKGLKKEIPKREARPAEVLAAEELSEKETEEDQRELRREMPAVAAFALTDGLPET
jgi:hypothetical protein